MAEGSESTPTPSKITLKVKTTTSAYDIEVAPNATVGEVKRELSSKTSQPVERHTLIFSGKILKDADTLEQYSIKDGMAIHLVIRQNTPSATPARPAATVQPSPAPSNPAPSAAAANPFASLAGNFMQGGGAAAAGAGNPMGMLGNPEMMQAMMNSPMMQQLMNNPNVFRSLLTENPQIQQLMESNPELGHLLNDPEMLRQTMEMIRNPNMFQEMMRNHDQAIRNLQGIPGGEAALQRLYNEVQEPLLNSATSSLGGNPFAAMQGNNQSNPATSRSQNAGVENAEALPNPWGGSGAAASGANAAGTGGAAGLGGMGGLAGLPGLNAGSLGAMMNSPGMQSMMQQMMANPSMMQNLMTPEAMQSMTQMLQSNPEILSGVLGSGAAAAGNPLSEQMRAALPGMLSNMNMPELVNAMTNPRVVEAMRQIQAGVEVIRQEAPAIAHMFGPGFSLPSGASSTASTAGSAASGAASSPSGAPDSMAALQALMAQMGMGQDLGAAADGMGAVPPEQRFASQLQQLQTMGFTDQAANINALLASFGDVNGAIERLLQ